MSVDVGFHREPKRTHPSDPSDFTQVDLEPRHLFAEPSTPGPLPGPAVRVGGAGESDALSQSLANLDTMLQVRGGPLGPRSGRSSVVLGSWSFNEAMQIVFKSCARVAA